MIRRVTLTLAVASAVIVFAPTLIAGESAARPSKPAIAAKGSPGLERSGYIVASS